MSHRRLIAAATICSALALQAACAIGRGIQETLGAMASGGEPPPRSQAAGQRHSERAREDCRGFSRSW